MKKDHADEYLKNIMATFSKRHLKFALIESIFVLCLVWTQNMVIKEEFWGKYNNFLI